MVGCLSYLVAHCDLKVWFIRTVLHVSIQFWFHRPLGGTWFSIFISIPLTFYSFCVGNYLYGGLGYPALPDHVLILMKVKAFACNSILPVDWESNPVITNLVEFYLLFVVRYFIASIHQLRAVVNERCLNVLVDLFSNSFVRSIDQLPNNRLPILRFPKLILHALLPIISLSIDRIYFDLLQRFYFKRWITFREFQTYELWVFLRVWILFQTESFISNWDVESFHLLKVQVCMHPACRVNTLVGGVATFTVFS